MFLGNIASLFSYNFGRIGNKKNPFEKLVHGKEGSCMDKTSLQTPKQDPFTDKQFGGYSMLEHLGKGGMGDVYKALQVGLDRVVAIKILPSLLARNSEFSERFFTEAYAISRLQHQNIVTIYDYGDEDGQKYIAMQYIQGTTLSKIIKENKKLDYTRIVGITKQICRGLKYAHQNDIVHRDIKSGNIMIEPGDKVYISDFGIAKVIDAPSITTTGMAMGTPEYMAPEQCEGGLVDGQSDIYGLGIIIYEMVTGRPPFLADTPLAVAYKQVHETPPLLSKKCPDVPLRLELIVAKCLKKNKADRYINADALLHDLDSAHIEMAPQDAPKEYVPSDLRITDRRGLERRHPDEPMAISRGYLWGILGSFAIVLGTLAYVLLKPSMPTSVAIGWQMPIRAEGKSATAGEYGSLGADHLIDGKRSTAWVAPAGPAKEDAEVEFTFSHQVMLTSITIETGLTLADGSVPGFSHPKSVTLEIEGRKALRFNLAETETPQILNLGGVILEKGKLRFSNATSGTPNGVAAGMVRPIAVREVRFLGLPYD
jgi:eukaryotic-like serine/threonine-protein kinase